MSPVSVVEGGSPVVLAFPHSGTFVPDAVGKRLNSLGRELADTDWHVDQLYAGLLPTATTVRANFHRYVIDANRDPAGGSLYPGQNTTGLIPHTTFDGEPIWNDALIAGREDGDLLLPSPAGKGWGWGSEADRPRVDAGVEPPPQPLPTGEGLHGFRSLQHGMNAAEIERRTAAWHAPYHAALAAQLERVRKVHGVAVLFDCHSIRSQIPFLFSGELPDLNLGTNSGQSCAQVLHKAAQRHLAAATGYTHVVNGRFKGGWTTRHYGQPQNGVHAIQLELAQRSYLAAEAAPFAYDPSQAQQLRAVLGPLLAELEHIALSGDLA